MTQKSRKYWFLLSLHILSLLTATDSKKSSPQRHYRTTFANCNTKNNSDSNFGLLQIKKNMDFYFYLHFQKYREGFVKQ